MNSPIKKLPCKVVDIIDYIPHRYPFLLIDVILEYQTNLLLKTQKNVTYNEPYFEGHFPKYPIMPGVLILEALAQTSGVLAILSDGVLSKNNLFFLAGINDVRFKKTVLPGDILILHAELIKTVKTLYKFKTKAYVEDKIVAEADIVLVKGEVKNEQDSFNIHS